VSEGAQGGPPAGPDSPQGRPRGREEDQGTIRNAPPASGAPAAHPQGSPTQPPRVAPSGPPVQPRPAPGQATVLRPPMAQPTRGIPPYVGSPNPQAGQPGTNGWNPAGGGAGAAGSAGQGAYGPAAGRFTGPQTRPGGQGQPTGFPPGGAGSHDAPNALQARGGAQPGQRGGGPNDQRGARPDSAPGAGGAQAGAGLGFGGQGQGSQRPGAQGYGGQGYGSGPASGQPGSGGGQQTGVPVWDAPTEAPTRRSLRERWGFGKKAVKAEPPAGVPDSRPSADSPVSAGSPPTLTSSPSVSPAAARYDPGAQGGSARQNPGGQVGATSKNPGTAGAAGAAAATSGASATGATGAAVFSPSPTATRATGATALSPSPTTAPKSSPATPPPLSRVGDTIEPDLVPKHGAVPGVPKAVAVPPVNPGPVPGGVASSAAAASSVGAGTASRAKAGTARRTRKARLRLSRLDPWSVMKTSFLFSIAAGIMLVVAVYVVWTVLESSGLFESVNDIVKSVVSTPGDTTPFRVQDYVNTQKVMGVAALVACVDVVIFTALATLGSFLYNLAATMLGGLEITLAED
jgi:hypothetical protein